MPSSIFISYCRREAPFVDFLETALEKEGHDVWLDFKIMVPGQPWQPQIEEGIKKAEILILVISKESMASTYVEEEWLQAVDESKRVILVLFEAVPLPEKLTQYEWVDFRTSFKNGMQQLSQIISSTKKMPTEAAPQSGFKVPFAVWAALLLSVATAVLSLYSIWTIILPFYLVPLPYRILKRDYDYSRVQFSLIMLPFVTYLGGFFIYAANDDLSFFADGLIFPSILFVLALLFLLHSNPLQRWGKPMATRPHFKNLYKPDNDNSNPITYWLDHAPQDQKYATALGKELNDQGHQEANSLQEAEATLVLVSAYKGDSAVAAESKIYYPVILQKNNEMSEALKEIQWIDMRRGLRNMTALAKLLPEPARLLRALGTAPTSERQTIMPRSIQALTFFLTILSIFTFGTFAAFILQLLGENGLYTGNGFGLILALILYVGLTVFTVRALTSRTTSFKRFAIALGSLTLIWIVLMVLYFSITDAAGITDNMTDHRDLGLIAPMAIFIIGVIPVSILAFRDWFHFWRWFPAGKKATTAQPSQTNVAVP